MAEIGITIAAKLIEVVGSKAIREVCSIWGYKSQLDDLKDTITTIRNVLLDAESKDKLTHDAQHYIGKLKDAVYDADDLFDEFLTLAQLKQHNKDAKLSEKVHDFFSSKKNSLSVAISMSRQVKKLRKKLAGIASNHNTFGFSVDPQPLRERREETCSYVYSDEVVGRECDLSKVVRMLLDPDSQDRLSFLSIVGVGGLGKTTLAQLVFNDEKVRTEFPLMLWTCVSDENKEDFDVKTILARILESASGDKHDGLSMDLVQRKLLGFLGGKRCLIVLDDVWNEDREKWIGLRKFLMSCGGGSRVLVTTRSERTAMVVDERHKYALEGLSPENSWRLFEMTAFGEKGGQDDVNSSELIKLGQKIVQQCSNVPLAIKIVGTLLYGQNESKWRFIQEYGLAKLNDGDNKVMSILKLSYDNLESPLKTCFTYCALFPKDFIIKKKKLIRLWMAQGYIVPSDVGQSMEDVGEEYFSILLRRCFFQDVIKKDIGGVESFKIHDLIHDVAQKVAGKGGVAVNSIQTNVGDEAHHIFHIGSKCNTSIFSKCKIRTYVRNGFEINFPLAKLVENWKFLRTLDLHDLDIETLPNSIGKLLHLRYLDLSHNKRLAALPDSITKLYNLQTLDLKGCSDLVELPKGLAKLTNLRQLDISSCRKLSHMPSSLDKLSCLCVLTQFVASEGISFGGVENLQKLKNLREDICIRFTENFKGAMESREGYLKSMKHLEVLTIDLLRCENHEKLLENFEPPLSLKGLTLLGYREASLPSRWCGVGKEGNWATFLPNVVHVKLHKCSNLLHFPCLSKLLHLKILSLNWLDKLEYIEDSTHKGSCTPVFFPSLERLQISDMKELRGWWRGEDRECNDSSQPFFSRLSVLEISRCEKLASFPACISLEMLSLIGVNKKLRITSMGKENHSIKLKEVTLSDLDDLKSLTTEGLTSICIIRNVEIESLSGVGETFKGCPSVRNLTIMNCNKLRSLEGAEWEHLTALDSLHLSCLPKLTFSGRAQVEEEEGDDDTVMRFISHLKYTERVIQSLQLILEEEEEEEEEEEDFEP